MATFYMVYIEGSSSTTYRHATLDGAEQEAKRLSENLNKKAYVLTTIKSFEVCKFKIEDCRPSENTDQLPF